MELALHLGVYGIVISSNLLKPEYGQVCKEFIKNHRSHLRFYLNALESAWTEWVQQWRSDPVFVKSLKACIVIDAKQTVRNHKWLHESVGLVDCQLRPVIFDDNWMRFMTLCNIPIVCTEPAYNANDVLLKLTDPVELLCAPYNDILQVPLKVRAQLRRKLW